MDATHRLPHFARNDKFTVIAGREATHGFVIAGHEAAHGFVIARNEAIHG
jgi:hypothetical protein